MRSGVIALLAVVAGLVVWFFKPIFHGIFWIAGLIIHIVVGAALLVPGWAIAAAINIFAALIPVAAVAVVLCILIVGLKVIIQQFAAVASQLDAMSVDGKQAAIDTGVVTVLATGAAAIAYVATDDFLDHFQTLKFLAVASISCCVGKMALLIPARPAKYAGLVITVLAAASTAVFLYFHFKQINWSAIDPTRGFAFVVILFLFAAAAGYPFTVGGWRRLGITPSR